MVNGRPCDRFFMRSTPFADVAQGRRIAGEEIVGPVLSVLTFRTPDAAVATADQ